jgi:hypothetical protein
MGRNNADFQGVHISDGEDPHFYDPEDKGRRLALHKDGAIKAELHYKHDPSDMSVEVDMLRSHEGGKGYANALVEHLYNKFTGHHIAWGEIQHPAASHLYKKFSAKYGRSSSWEDWEDDY